MTDPYGEQFPGSGAVAPKEILEAIGLVVTYWSRLEMAVEDTIHLVGKLDVGLLARCITADMGLPQRLDTILALSKLVLRFDPTLQAELKGIIKDIRDGRDGEPSLQTQRNRIVHAYYARMGDSPRVSSASIRTRGGKLKFDVRPRDRAEMIEVAGKIAAMVERVDDWAKRVREHLRKNPHAFAFL
jgi:hypothetical protein